MKLREWFSIKGVLSERRKVSWLSRKELIKNSAIVIAFCIVFGAYFFASDAIIAFILKLLGLN